MLKSYLILFFFIFLNSLVLSVNAQSIISSSGSTIINENYILEFTLGELAIDEFENGTIGTQGIQGVQGTIGSQGIQVVQMKQHVEIYFKL